MHVYLFVIILLFKEALPLRILRVTVPTYRVRGQPAQLECDYELGADALYAVKWYRDNEEFYRYIPNQNPSKSAFKLEGINVDLENSDDRKLVLRQVTLKSTGLYRCEVSGDAPTFDSAAGEGRMEVILRNSAETPSLSAILETFPFAILMTDVINYVSSLFLAKD